MRKKIICILLVVTIIFSNFTAVYADDSLQLKLEAALKNSGNIISIAADLIKKAIAKFKDVKESDWYAEAVGKLSTMDIVNGMPGGNFNPQGEVTRAQFIKMLVQAMEYKKIDSVSFVDLKPYPTSKPHWASVYIETALRNGVIVKEETGNNFYPDAPLTRRDMAMMMFRSLKLKPSIGENPFADLTEENGYYTKLYEEYLLRGTPKNDKVILEPEALSTRAQAAVIISRMLEYKENPFAYVEAAAMDERFAKGIQTAEDIVVKRKQEIAKAKADPNYIMEPIITVERNEERRKYEYFRLFFENMVDYTDDAKWKLEITNYKQLNNYEMPMPNGTFVKKTITGWRPLGSAYKDSVRASSYRLGSDYYTTQDKIKDLKISQEMKIEFKITIKKGTNEKVIYKTVVVDDNDTNS